MRVKRGVTTKKKHKRLKREVRGYGKTRRASVKKAREAVLIAREHAYVSRKGKKRTFRALWIKRINNALTPHDISYSRFIAMLNKNKIELDRKSLSELAVNHPEQFNALVLGLKK